MLINQTNNNDGQAPELAKIFKDVHFNPNTNMWIHHEDEAIYVCVSRYTMRMKRYMYVYLDTPWGWSDICMCIIPSLSLHPYHVCKAITYVVLMLWLFFSLSLSNDRKIFSKCKRIIVKILMQFPLHKRSQIWFLRRSLVL